MATRQSIAPGFPFPAFINETGKRQAVAPGLYVDETVSTTTTAPNFGWNSVNPIHKRFVRAIDSRLANDFVSSLVQVSSAPAQPTLVDQASNVASVRQRQRSASNEIAVVLSPASKPSGFVHESADIRPFRRTRTIALDHIASVAVLPAVLFESAPDSLSIIVGGQRSRLKRQDDSISEPINFRVVIASFVSQWHHQWDSTQRAKPKSYDASFGAPIGIAPGEFLVSFVSQWHHQWDTSQRAKPRLLDVSFAGVPISIAPTPTVSIQWHPQSDIARLRPFKITAADTPLVSPGALHATYVSQWQHDFETVFRWKQKRLDISLAAPINPQLGATLVDQWHHDHEAPRKAWQQRLPPEVSWTAVTLTGSLDFWWDSLAERRRQENLRVSSVVSIDPVMAPPPSVEIPWVDQPESSSSRPRYVIVDQSVVGGLLVVTVKIIRKAVAAVSSRGGDVTIKSKGGGVSVADRQGTGSVKSNSGNVSVVDREGTGSAS